MKKNRDGNSVNSVQSVGENIRRLRRQAHLSQQVLARRLGIRQGPLSNLENGKNLPSAAVVLQLAEVLGVSTDRILRPQCYVQNGLCGEEEAPPGVCAESAVEYCPGKPAAGGASGLLLTNRSPGPLKDADYDRIDSVVNDYLALEDLCGVPRQANIPLRLVFELSLPGMEQLARQVRALLGIGSAIVFDLLELFENHGMRVVFLPLPEPARVLAFYDARHLNVFLLIHEGMNPEKQIFSLAYGLGRILLFNRIGAEGEQVREKRGDKLARHFAACLLMPAEVVHNSVRQVGVGAGEWCWALLLRLKHRFGVSAQALNYRLLELGLITPERQLELLERIQRECDAESGFMEPGESRRILSPNGRLGDLLLTARRRTEADAREIAARLAGHGVVFRDAVVRTGVNP